MAGGDPRIVGHVDVARFHILKLEVPTQSLYCFGHGVDMPWRAGHGLRQHPALKVENTCRDIPTLAHDWGKGGAYQRLTLFLDHGQKPIP